MTSARQRGGKHPNRNGVEGRGNWITDVPTFTTAFLRSKGPLRPIQRVALIGVSSALAVCGIVACLDAIDSFRNEGSSFSVTALPGIVLLAAGLVGLMKAIMAKSRPRK